MSGKVVTVNPDKKAAIEAARSQRVSDPADDLKELRDALIAKGVLAASDVVAKKK